MSTFRSSARLAVNIFVACIVAFVLFVAPGILGAGDNLAPVSSAPLAASAGPNFAATATSGTWSSPANATGPNNNVCATSINSTNPIDLTNFSFSIPTGSVITGILVEPKAGYDGANNMSAQLLKAGTPVGNAKSWGPPNISDCSVTTFASLGGAGDLWSTTWTVSDINAINFGIRIVPPNVQDQTAFLDAVRITILFDPPTPPPATVPARPAEVPEADTLLLMSGGLGGLVTWVGWQRRKRRTHK